MAQRKAAALNKVRRYFGKLEMEKLIGKFFDENGVNSLWYFLKCVK